MSLATTPWFAVLTLALLLGFSTLSLAGETPTKAQAAPAAAGTVLSGANAPGYGPGYAGHMGPGYGRHGYGMGSGNHLGSGHGYGMGYGRGYGMGSGPCGR